MHPQPFFRFLCFIPKQTTRELLSVFKQTLQSTLYLSEIQQDTTTQQEWKANLFDHIA